MKINGKPALACFTKISELNSDTVTVEPMDNFPIVRDLVVGFERMINNHKKVMPYVIRDDSEIDPESGMREFLQSPENVEKYIQFSSCIKCGLCNSACPTMAMDKSICWPSSISTSLQIHCR